MTNVAPTGDLTQAGETGEEAQTETEEMQMKKVPYTKAVLPVIASAGMDYFGLGLLTPILPYKVEMYNADESYVGYITTAQYLGVLIGGLILGRVADIYSRKLAIQIACAGDVVFFLLTGFCPTAVLLLACRFFAGSFTPLVASISWVIDSGQGDVVRTTQMMATWAFTMSSSFMAGSVVGGLLGAENWLIVHSLSSGLALLAFLCISFSEPPPRPNATEKPKGIDKIVRAPEYLALMLMNVYVGIHFTGGIIAASLILAYQLGVSTIQISLFFVATSIFHAFFNFALLPLTTKYFGTPIVAMKLSTIMSSIASVLLCFDFALDSLVGCYLLLIFASTLLPVLMTTANIYSGQYADRHTKNARTVVLGISRLAFNVGQVLGPLIAIACISYGSNLVFYLLSAVLSVGVFVNWLVQHNKAMASMKAEVGAEEEDVRDERKEKDEEDGKGV